MEEFKLEKCDLCKSEAVFHPINKIYVHCSNPDCILSDRFINRERWNAAMEKAKP